jgi:hypothetical protein
MSTLVAGQIAQIRKSPEGNIPVLFKVSYQVHPFKGDVLTRSPDDQTITQRGGSEKVGLDTIKFGFQGA